jgi:hypothetical protein
VGGMEGISVCALREREQEKLEDGIPHTGRVEVWLCSSPVDNPEGTIRGQTGRHLLLLLIKRIDAKNKISEMI